MRPLVHLSMAVIDALVIDKAREIIPYLRLEFGLRRLEAKKVWVEGEITHRRVDRLRRDAGARGLRPQFAKALLKPGGSGCRKEEESQSGKANHDVIKPLETRFRSIAETL